MNFPNDFVWGTATASYQIEGAVKDDGRGASIWDTFSHTPGAVKNGDTGDVACDHYHRWQEDIERMPALNVNAYRFSIAWSRIFPEGRGQVNQTGIDFYSRLVDGLLNAGITPFVTLYHWDLPQALEDEDGWLRRGIAEDFAAYADAVSRALGDRVKQWITLNEPWVFTWLGYVIGAHAPGRLSTNPAPALIASHNANLAHAYALPVIRRNVDDAKVGITLNLTPADPATNKSDDMRATARYDGNLNRWYLDPLFRGHYPPDMVEEYDEAMPDIRPGDMERIRTPIDFLGVNYYTRAVVCEDQDSVAGFKTIKPDGEYTSTEWEVYPRGLYQLLMRLHRDYNPRALYITENGSAFDDVLTPEGEVHDERRTAYFRGHLEAAAQAIEDGVPLKGYFAWSLMDNFEWAEGYSKRFGLYYVDYATQARYLKDSGKYYAAVAGGKG